MCLMYRNQKQCWYIMQVHAAILPQLPCRQLTIAITHVVQQTHDQSVSLTPVILLLSRPVYPSTECTRDMGMCQACQACGSLLLQSSMLLHPVVPGCKGAPQRALQQAAHAICHSTALHMPVGYQILPAGKGLCLQEDSRLHQPSGVLFVFTRSTGYWPCRSPTLITNRHSKKDMTCDKSAAHHNHQLNA